MVGTWGSTVVRDRRGRKRAQFWASAAGPTKAAATRELRLQYPANRFTIVETYLYSISGGWEDYKTGRPIRGMIRIYHFLVREK